MSSGGESDRHCEHLGVSQTKHDKKKKSRRPIDPEDIGGYISSTPERISHDTHLFVVSFGTANPRQYYPNYHRPVGASSTSHVFPLRRYEDDLLYRLFVEHDPYRKRFVHPDVSPLSTATPSATPDDTMRALAFGKKDRLGRVMIEPDRSSWHSVKDAARALKDCVRRLYTHAYHSWSEIPNSIHQAMFNNFKYWNTDKLKAISVQAKKARGSLKEGSLHNRGAKTVGTIAREMEKELGCTPIEPEVFKKTHDRKKENESDPDVWVEERAEQTFNDFHQYVIENLDRSVQLSPELSPQIFKEKVVGGTPKGRFYGLGYKNDVRRFLSCLEAALAVSEQRRVAEQESMTETVQQIKEQVMNLARRPTTSAPDDTDDESDEDDYEKELGCTPIEPEVFKKTHVRKKENESDPDVWVEERAEQTFNDFHQYVIENLDSSVQLTPELSTQICKEKVVRGTHKGRFYGLGSQNDVRRFLSGLEGIGSSRQVDALDGVQIVAMSDQIAKLTAALAVLERRRVAEQESIVRPFSKSKNK
ncbi:hypothetical protein MTR67_002797 [Solanum verrucosum]|uniref:Uncharacterized protein n=1 Tax=Solanum verrucosum TaxID=315347 RepID=A0AAF0T6A0_SOLVR|nr:hypothetical protein MTR67_002797 [Solanum verrucosum]